MEIIYQRNIDHSFMILQGLEDGGIEEYEEEINNSEGSDTSDEDPAEDISAMNTHNTCFQRIAYRQ